MEDEQNSNANKEAAPPSAMDCTVGGSLSEDKVKEPLSIDTSETETVSVDGDRYSGFSSASTPTKLSSGDSTPSSKRSISPPLCAQRITPESDGSGTKTPGNGDGSQRQEETPRTHHRPSRAGIVWRVNGKLEAKDYQEKWFSARIVEIDDADHTALIHFDGWNSRFDEWMNMKSSRLRPITRHSGRKEKPPVKTKISRFARTALSHEDHKLGDNVFAKWTDCRMYAGTIVNVNPNGSYQVLFYDGVKKTVQPINVKPMPLEVQKEYAVAGVLPDPSKRPKDRVHMMERLEKESTPDESEAGTGEGHSSKLTPDGSSVCSTDSSFSLKLEKIPEKPRRSQEGRTPETKRAEDGPKFPAAKKKLMITGPFQTTKKVKTQTGKPVFRKDRRRESDPSRNRKKQESRRERPLMKQSMKDRGGAGDEITVGPRLKKTAQRSRPIVMRVEDSSDDEVSLATIARQRTTSTTKDGAPLAAPKIVKKPRPSTSSLSSELGQGHLSHERGECGPKNAFQVEAEHNKFKCPFENCPKSYRKLNLVEYHVKYYHSEDGKILLPPPAKKRRQTLSVCSSDSEMSTGGKISRSGSRQRRRDSSICTAVTDMSGDAVNITTNEDTAALDFSEVETHTTTTDEPDNKDTLLAEECLETSDIVMDCLSKDELVNCICQLNEENGLMIQCDVCLCWQHALCMEITEDTLPSKYICYVCANPPGVRDSARYAYDQDWLKQGTMSTFNFLREDRFFPQKAQIMQATHGLVGDMHGVQRQMKSLSCQLNALKDKNHPEVKFWTKNWDKVIEEQRITEAEHQIKQERRQTEAEEQSIAESGHLEIKQEIKTEPLDEFDHFDSNTDDQNAAMSSEQTFPSIEEQDPSISKPEVDQVTSEDTCLMETEAPDTQELPQEIITEDTEVPAQDAAPGVTESQGQATISTHASSSSLSSFRSESSEMELQPSTSQDTQDVKPVLTVHQQPFVSCEQNLLQHVNSIHDGVESRLDLIEQQIEALESADDNGNNHSTGDVLRDLPRVKKSIHQILFDLVKVKRMALFH